MASMVERMLDQAVEFVERNPDSGAAKRRAVSTAYYAAFHEVMWLCAREVVPHADIDSPEFERVYRQIDHGPLKQAFISDGPLKANLALRQIGDDLVQLQDARKLADYAPPRPDLFSLAKAREHVGRARDIVMDLESLNDRDRRTLAIHLLFPVRKK